MNPETNNIHAVIVKPISEYSFISNLEINVKQFTSYILSTSSLALSGSTAIPEVVSSVEACAVSLFQPPLSPPPSARIGRLQVGHTLQFC